MAFRLQHPPDGRHYLVTSHSLFGPAADLDVQMTPDDIARVIIAAIGISCDHASELVTARPYLRIPDARRSDETGSEKDLALFEIRAPAHDAPALTLDPAPPIKGDRVWIYIKHPGKPTTGLEGATIAWTTEKELRYLLDNPAADLRGTTGAPVLSATGGVIGINLGTFTAKSGRVYGYACPGSSIRRALEPGWTPAPSPLRSHP
ncbi:serine protease [Opitutaceae bacterium TAV4]|nr:serine protease [Opitutaceae bacterium TAV4]